MERWVAATRGEGRVTRLPGTWDFTGARTVARVASRKRKQCAFRAAKGEEADGDGTWGFECVKRLRTALPARVVSGYAVMDALIVWRGEWGEEQEKWLKVDKAHFPGANGKRLIRLLRSRFAKERGGPVKRVGTRVTARLTRSGAANVTTRAQRLSGKEASTQIYESESEDEPSPLERALARSVRAKRVLAFWRAEHTRHQLGLKLDRAKWRAYRTYKLIGRIKARHLRFEAGRAEVRQREDDE